MWPRPGGCACNCRNSSPCWCLLGKTGTGLQAELEQLTGGLNTVMAQVEQAEAIWRLKQHEADEAESICESAKLAAAGAESIRQLDARMAQLGAAKDEAERELAAAHEEVLKQFC